MSSTTEPTITPTHPTEEAKLMPPPPPPTLPPPPPIALINPNPQVFQQKKEFQRVRWTRLDPDIGNGKLMGLPVGRHGHRAVGYKNLMIVFGGGNEGLFDDVSVYNTSSNEWFQPVCKGDGPSGGLAGYGAVIDGHRILIFGGMNPTARFTNKLYELNVQRWEWTLLQPKPRSPSEEPVARLGHSFTLVKDKVFMFGGLANYIPEGGNNNNLMEPKYLNDVCVLNVRLNMQHGVWEMPVTYGNPPCPRESHSAVYFKDARHNRIVIYGGMFANRLGDLFTLDIDTMMWTQIRYDGRSYFPLPRSLHSATVVGDRMYVFGGWVQTNYAGDDPSVPLSSKWRCDNSTSSLNLRTMTWEKVNYMNPYNLLEAEFLPWGRAGHSAVVINNKIYVWAGRDGYARAGTLKKQVCHNDLWKLEVLRLGIPDKVKLIKASSDGLCVGWDPVPGADGYILQISTLEIPPSNTIEVTGKENSSSLPIPQNVGARGHTMLALPPPVLHQGMQMVPQQAQFRLPGPNQYIPPGAINPRTALHPNMLGSMIPRVGFQQGFQSPQQMTASSGFINHNGHQGMGNFRMLGSQGMIGQSSGAPPFQSPIGGQGPPFGVANQWGGQNPSPMPMSQADLWEYMRQFQQQAQQGASMSSTPTLSLQHPPATTAPQQTQLITAPADSTLMPPPPPVQPPAQNSPQKTPPKPNTPQGSAVGQRSGNYVRILAHSPTGKSHHQQQNQQQRFCLTGSHGIPGSSSQATQAQPQQSQQRPPAVHSRTSQNENGGIQQQVSVSSSLAPQLSGRSTPLVLTPQQMQSLLMSSAPGMSAPVRFVGPGQLQNSVGQQVRGQEPTRMQRFFSYRMPDGRNMVLPVEMLTPGATIRHFRMASPVPVRKVDGRKMVAVEGMLRLAGSQGGGQMVQRQGGGQLIPTSGSQGGGQMVQVCSAQSSEQMEQRQGGVQIVSVSGSQSCGQMIQMSKSQDGGQMTSMSGSQGGGQMVPMSGNQNGRQIIPMSRNQEGGQMPGAQSTQLPVQPTIPQDSGQISQVSVDQSDGQDSGQVVQPGVPNTEHTNEATVTQSTVEQQNAESQQPSEVETTSPAIQETEKCEHNANEAPPAEASANDPTENST